ncbi:hypothetical protein B0H13DRAFT_2047013 [Mycena leptocephala]|nr:hypothetical protein B0H13DRAFT_2047013 [Mycena leptocephala]
MAHRRRLRAPVRAARAGARDERGVEREGRVRAGRPCIDTPTRGLGPLLLLRLLRLLRLLLPPPPLLPLALPPLVHLPQQRLQHRPLRIQHRAPLLLPRTPRTSPRRIHTHTNSTRPARNRPARAVLFLHTAPRVVRVGEPHERDAERRARGAVHLAVEVAYRPVRGEVRLEEGVGREGREAREEHGGGGRGEGVGVVLIRHHCKFRPRRAQARRAAETRGLARVAHDHLFLAYCVLSLSIALSLSFCSCSLSLTFHHPINQLLLLLLLFLLFLPFLTLTLFLPSLFLLIVFGIPLPRPLLPLERGPTNNLPLNPNQHLPPGLPAYPLRHNRGTPPLAHERNERAPVGGRVP